MDIKVLYKVNDNDLLPEYKTNGAAGADLKSSINAVLYPGQKKIIPTGLFLQIPEGYEGQIRPRSGLVANNSITVFNAPGTIDSDYRGEIKVILINLSSPSWGKTFEIKKGDRIAQIVFSPVVRVSFVPAELDVTKRNESGFGSTGISGGK